MKREIGACIVELHGRYAAALTDDGQFLRIPNRRYQVGQTLLLSARQTQAKPRIRVASLTSIAAGLLLLVVGGFAGYQSPVGVVSLDVNPSIEFTINCFDRVLAIDAVNDDGGDLIERMDESALLNQPVDAAVEQAIAALLESGYLAEETENDVVLSASSYSARHAEGLAARLKLLVAKHQDLCVISVSVSQNEVEAAHALGTSAGKLYLVERLEQSLGGSDAFDQSDWLKKPVREIVSKTEEQTQSIAPQGGAQSTTKPAPTPSAGQPTDSAHPPEMGNGAAGDDNQPPEAGATAPVSDEKQNMQQGNPGADTQSGGGRSPQG